eukprot:5644752-Prymnesium_polylepis.1
MLIEPCGWRAGGRRTKREECFPHLPLTRHRPQVRRVTLLSDTHTAGQRWHAPPKRALARADAASL